LIAPLKTERSLASTVLPPVGRAHMIGVAGAGMQALAMVLARQGWWLTGSDQAPENATALAGMGVKVFSGHDAQHVGDDLSLVIHSDAIEPENVERRQAARLRVPEMCYPQVVASLMAKKRGMAIAGTHGKSTTTAMIAQVLTDAAFDPTVICGATNLEPANSPGTLRLAAGEWLVAEACEYRANFLRFAPEIAVVLGVEPDHFDYYRSFDELKAVFAQWIAGVRQRGGTQVLNFDCPTMREQIATASIGEDLATFGRSRDAEWRPVHIRHMRGLYRFEIHRAGRFFCEASLRVPGGHQITNALAAAVACHAAGATPEEISRGLSRFAGLRRRLEHVDCGGQAVLLDDYAHHPTEIRATLAAVRMMYPGRRISCIFQPHQVSRTLALLDEFAASLQNADSVAVTEVFAAREMVNDARRLQVSGHLADRVRSLGARTAAECRSEIVFSQIVRAARAGDIIVTLGAGDIRKRCDELADRIRIDRPQR